MTEQEWLASTHPEPMLAFLRGRASVRKFRLFAVACCRRIWHLYRTTYAGRAVVVAERLADGLPFEETLDELRWKAYDEGFERIEFHDWQQKENRIIACTAFAACHALADEESFLGNSPRDFSTADLLKAAERAAEAVAHRERRTSRHPPNEVAGRKEAQEQVTLLRDIFGDPFRAASMDPAWRSPVAVELARMIYEERSFEDLPVLADALEEAGCADRDVLAHCRGPGVHARGCWPVDLILGRS